MYNYRKFQLEMLTLGLEDFEHKNTFELDDDVLDKVWDVSIEINDNPRIKKFFGRYYYSAQKIEITTLKFNGNLLAIRDTVLHELAHHITNMIFPGAPGHGDEWKSVCRVLGADPSSSKSLREWNLKWNEVKNNGFYSQYKIKG